MIAIREKIKQLVVKAARKAGFVVDFDFSLETPDLDIHGDYATNIALILAKKSGKNPLEAANLLKTEILRLESKLFEKLEVAGPGFINFWLKQEYFLENIKNIIKIGDKFGRTKTIRQKVMVEYAHPNTHKEMHIGHMRTLITGEALARILEFAGAKIFRANYQGDIGPHVAKSIWGTAQILKERNQAWEQWETKPCLDKAHLLGEGYVRGNRDYEGNKEEIDDLNAKLYRRDKQVMSVYLRTRKWSLDYYDDFYKRFNTRFDRLFFESEVANPGKKIVLENIGKVFEKSQGAVIFDGEKYGLHKRVFVTADGYPTYEGKDMALARLQAKVFRFDRNIHVVANEQAEYFKVIFKALELLDPWFKGKEYHLSMGMVNLVNQKISSRQGIVITVDGLLRDVESLVKELASDHLRAGQEAEGAIEKITLGAVKYSVLKTHPTLNVEFDLKQSVSLEGDSGPYIQYTYARAKSVMQKSNIKNKNDKSKLKKKNDVGLNNDELMILRWLIRFPEIVARAAGTLAPNLVCGYLFELCQKFNLFYQKNRIIGSENEAFRLILTRAVSQTVKNGLWLLGIDAPERM